MKKNVIYLDEKKNVVTDEKPYWVVMKEIDDKDEIAREIWGKAVGSSKALEKKQRSFLWYDTCLSLDHAVALGSKGNNVYYFVEYRTMYPRIEDYIAGYGFKEIQKITDWAEVLDHVDVIVFVDVGFGSLADMLRKKGYRVFGASARGEMLELDRVYMLKKFKEAGLKVPEHVIVQGVSALKEKCAEMLKNGSVFVKHNIFRGNLETMRVRSVDELENAIEEARFGAVKNDMQFILTKEVKGVELGVDLLFDGKEFLRPYVWGNEVKMTGSQFSKIVNSSVWDDVLEKIEPLLAESGYRGAFSLEGIFDGSDIYLLDVTARLFFPGSSIYSAFLENYDDVITAVANGEYVKPKFSYPYLSLLCMYRENSERWTKINVDDVSLVGKRVFLPRRAVKVNDSYWCAPGDSVIATIVGGDRTFDGSLSEVASNAGTVHAFEAQIMYEAIEKYKEQYLKELRSMGVEW